MCSIGHDAPDLRERAPRRHLDNSASKIARRMPRGELAKNRALVIASLRASISTDEAEALAEQHGAHQQLELMPPDMAQLPPASFRTTKLPKPEDLYWSSAREA